MTDGDMVWDAPGPFNAPYEEEGTTTDKPRPQECVGNDQHNDKILTHRSDMGDREIRGVESCLVDSIIGTEKVRHRQQMSYCEAANRGLTKTDIKM